MNREDDCYAETLVQSLVAHRAAGAEPLWFLVSTINRSSSAVHAYGGIYAETMVWEWLPNTRERGRLVGQDSSSRDSLFAHHRMVQRVFNTGKCDEEIPA